MRLIINKKEYTFENINEAIEKVAFEHYPLTLICGNEKFVFDSFDKVKDYLEKTQNC
ncbi:MAG: hypothetical protein ACI4MT_00220 [Christensenellales bacterium]